MSDSSLRACFAPLTAPSAQPRLRAPTAPVGWPAWRISGAIAGGELSATEAVRAHLDRLDEVEPTLNATTAVRREAALRDAAALDSALATGAAPGPLCGVPMTLKDVIASVDIPTCCGSAAFAGNVPSADAVAVSRARAAGAIVIAKTNCPEFAFGVTCGNEAYGVTRSPWGTHSPGGSSGGEAALVAAGASALGLGTDFGGSVRWPAACCGVLGLRPSPGLIDGTGQLPERGGRLDGAAGPNLVPDGLQRQLQVIGPLARTVRDLATAVAVLSDAAIPIDSDLRSLSGLGIGMVPDLDGGPVSTQAAAALSDAAAALRYAGLVLVDLKGALDGLHEAYNAIRATDTLTDLRAAVGTRQGRIGNEARQILTAAAEAELSSRDTASLWQRLERLRTRVAKQLERTPVLIAPVAPAPWCDLSGRATVSGRTLAGFALMAQCRAVSALGVPALSIPVGRYDNGLPVSIQVVAAAGHDALVLSVGALLERILGGHQEPPWLPSSLHQKGTP